MMRVPLATYRIQFTDKFTFQHAREIVDYLADLGISDLYASPIFQAKDRSVSGYDVVDPHRINAELGTSADFEQLTGKVRERGMGWLQDIVPNHMGYYGSNPMLADLLEKGHTSKYYDYFDIDWSHPYESMKGRVLAPFLGRFYGEELEDAQIELQYCETGFVVHYHDFHFPLRLESYPDVVTLRWNDLRKKLGTDHPDFIKLCGILYVIKNLPAGEEEGELYDQVAFIKRLLWELYTDNDDIRRHVDGNMKTFNGEQGNPESFRLLDRLLSDQHFRLSYWKVATEEINYRRFFTVNDLISLKMESEGVFNDVHAFIFKLVKEGVFTGLRIDHIDGLHDPTRYLEWLKERAGDTYILVEKILELEEPLPSFWPVQGTTGYDFINYANGVFFDRENAQRIDGFYRSFTGFTKPYEQIWYDNKKLILERHMTGDRSNLARLLKSALSEDRHGGDITLYGFQRAITEVLAHFPVYRTYVSGDVLRPTARRYIGEAMERARRTYPDLVHELNFMEKVLLLQFEDHLSEEERRKRLQFVMRFQQFTGPLMAKGFEDTTLYVFNRFVSLNEVGGSPDRLGISLEDFHKFNTDRSLLWPYAMNATATHDTKRGEDVRARLNVLSEIPLEWEEKVGRWSELNEGIKSRIGGGKGILDRNDEYFLYQTLVGSYPLDGDELSSYEQRIKEYMRKSVREAKVHSEWVNPDMEYEDAVLSFVEELLKPSEGNAFLRDFLPFQGKVAGYGIWNSLSQILLKAAAPGMPDFYQGTELWDFSLVDPDNRRPVDFRKRKELLAEILEKQKEDILWLVGELLPARKDGRIKLFLTHRLLEARRKKRALFHDGVYIPLESSGEAKDSIVAFARRNGTDWGVIVAPRFFTRLVGEGDCPVGENVWKDTCVELPNEAPSAWIEAVTEQRMEGDRSLPVGSVLKYFPVALLLSEDRG